MQLTVQEKDFLYFKGVGSFEYHQFPQEGRERERVLRSCLNALKLHRATVKEFTQTPGVASLGGDCPKSYGGP